MVKKRAKVAVPALRDTLVTATLAKKSGFMSWMGRQGVWALSALLTPRLVEAVVDKVDKEVRALDAGPRGMEAQQQLTR